MSELVSGCNGFRDAMITFVFSDWVAVVMKIKNPRLQLCVLLEKNMVNGCQLIGVKLCTES